MIRWIHPTRWICCWKYTWHIVVWHLLIGFPSAHTTKVLILDHLGDRCIVGDICGTNCQLSLGAMGVLWIVSPTTITHRLKSGKLSFSVTAIYYILFWWIHRWADTMLDLYQSLPSVQKWRRELATVDFFLHRYPDSSSLTMILTVTSCLRCIDPHHLYRLLCLTGLTSLSLI
jgi:hypothetical protein